MEKFPCFISLYLKTVYKNIEKQEAFSGWFLFSSGVIKIKLHLVFVPQQLNFFLYEEFSLQFFQTNLKNHLKMDGDMSSMNTG